MVSEALKVAWCIADFASDVGSAQALSQSIVKEVRFLGHLSAVCLLLLVPINSMVISSHRQRHRQMYCAIRKTYPNLDALVKLVALSNCEVMGASVHLARSSLPKEDQRAADIACRELGAKGLIAKLMEDLPQLVMQLSGAWIQVHHWNAENLAPVQILSLGTSFLSLFVQGYAAFILTVIDVNVSNPTLNIKAEKHKRRIDVFNTLSPDMMEIVMSSGKLKGGMNKGETKQQNNTYMSLVEL